MGRRRYVAFRVTGTGPWTRGEMEAALRRVSRGLPDDARPRLVRFTGTEGIVRCGHRAKERVIDALRSIRTVGGQHATVETLGTSGTIRKATKKYLAPRA